MKAMSRPEISRSQTSSSCRGTPAVATVNQVTQRAPRARIITTRVWVMAVISPRSSASTARPREITR